MRTLPTTLLQTFCKIILNSKVIIKSIIDPDDNFSRNSRDLLGWTYRRGGLFKRGICRDLGSGEVVAVDR